MTFPFNKKAVPAAFYILCIRKVLKTVRDNMCTAIKIDYEYGCVLGRTMDYEYPLNYNVIYLPKNYNFCNDLMGNPLYSKYRTLGICFEKPDP